MYYIILYCIVLYYVILCYISDLFWWYLTVAK